MSEQAKQVNQVKQTKQTNPYFYIEGLLSEIYDD